MSYIYIFCLQACGFLIYHHILNPESYLENEGQPPNIKRPFTLFWVVLEIKTTSLLHFKRSSSGKWIHIFPRLMVVMLHSY